MNTDTPRFERTQSGKVGRFNFHSLPLIWVEGDDDVAFFGQLLKKPCLLKSANGRDACEALAKSMAEGNLPFGVIMDSDYSAIIGNRISHCRVVYLSRYAIENYLAHDGVIYHVCLSYAGNDELLQDFDQQYELTVKNVFDSIIDLVALDVGHQFAQSGHKAFPDHCGSVCRQDGQISQAQLEELLNSSRLKLPKSAEVDAIVKQAHHIIVKSGALYLVRGHFVFSVLRNFILRILEKIGKKPTVDNRSMLILLSSQLARLMPSEHLEDRNMWDALVDQCSLARVSHLSNNTPASA